MNRRALISGALALPFVRGSESQARATDSGASTDPEVELTLGESSKIVRRWIDYPEDAWPLLLDDIETLTGMHLRAGRGRRWDIAALTRPDLIPPLSYGVDLVGVTLKNVQGPNYSCAIIPCSWKEFAWVIYEKKILHPSFFA